MKTALLLLVPLALGACKSSSPKVDLSSVPCNCGEPEARFDGCAHPTCAAGKRNPDNPDCVCGPLDFGDDD